MEQGRRAESKALRFDAATSDYVPRTNYQATAKYDRKTLKRRLEIEEWMYYELRRLYDCKAEEDTATVEIDIDALQRRADDEKRENMLKVLLREAKHPIKEFTTTLLEKIRQLDAPKQIATEEQEV